MLIFIESFAIYFPTYNKSLSFNYHQTYILSVILNITGILNGCKVLPSKSNNNDDDDDDDDDQISLSLIFLLMLETLQNQQDSMISLQRLVILYIHPVSSEPPLFTHLVA